jgi:hypothetical protein
LAWFSSGHPEIVVDSRAGLVCQLEACRPAGFLLPDGSSVQGIAAGCDVIDAERNDVTTAQLAVNGQVEQR